jgi:predicted RNase H-like nuclease (RuvC/YqgF family)
VSYGLGLMIEALVACLLLVTIGYCALLNHRLKRLKADEQTMKATIAELITATEAAERAVHGLQTAVHDSAPLREQVSSAERLSAELDRQLIAGETVLARLARVVVSARTLDNVPAAAATPDPKAVAAAAQSFTDRLRHRIGALAA